MTHKRLIAVGRRRGTRWVMRVQESSTIQQVTRKGIEQALERVFGENDKRKASK